MKTWLQTMGLGMTAGALLAMAAAAKETPELTLRAELERSVFPAGVRQDAVIRITIHAPGGERRLAPDRAKVNLAIVLDRSGSMGTANKLENAKEAAITALRMLGPEDVFSLVMYDDQAQTLVPPMPVRDYTEIERIIRTIRPGGSTALFAGVSTGAGEVRKNLAEGFVNRIILLSDGLANVGPSSPYDLGRLGASLVKEGISVSTVGVGNDYNEDVMTALSQHSDGNFYFVENSRDLPDIFTRELGGALSVFAQSVDLRIECPDGVTPQGIMGYDLRPRGQELDLHFNQVYRGHQRALIVNVEIPPGQPREQVKLADVRLSYQDLATGRRREVVQAIHAEYSADRQKIATSVNLDVVNTVALRNNAILKEQAVQKADAGDLQAAADMLEQAATQLERAADVTQDKDLRREAERSREHARQIEQKGNDGVLPSAARKQLRGESYQELNSQQYKQ